MFRRCARMLSNQARRFDPYTVLGVPSSASADEIKRAHRRLARQYHPDNAATGNAEKFKEVQTAFESLRDSNWTSPAASPDEVTPEQRAAGFYDTPGSTNENYVHGNTRLQTLLRIAVAWCLFFFATRMFLNAMFPPRKMQAILDDLEQTQRAASAQPASASGDATVSDAALSGGWAAHDVRTHSNGVDADPLARN